MSNDFQNLQSIPKFFTSEFLEHATIVIIFATFRSAIKDFGEAKMIRVRINGPNVNFATLRKIKDRNN